MELYSVIKNDGPGDLLFWKFLGEDFRTGSQLIVAENEEALFFKDGVIVETFSGGKFSLSTNNYPFIDTIRSTFSGGVSAFNCKVFFVNKAHALELVWGTDSPIQMRDPVHQIMVNLRGRGAYSVKVADSKKFFLKFVGNNIQAVDRNAIVGLFRSVFLQKIKSAIPKAVREANNEVLDICERLEEFAELIKPNLAPVMDEYGLELVNFYMSAMEIPEDDPSLDVLVTARNLRKAKEEAAIGDLAQMQILGDNWQRVQGRDILLSTAQNPGTPGAAAGAGVGIGVGMAAGGVMGAMANSVFSPFTQQAAPAAPATPAGSRFTPKAKPTDATECASCHAKNPGNAKFCSECGNPMAPAKSFCIQCGTEMPSSAKFCPECGSKQEKE